MQDVHHARCKWCLVVGVLVGRCELGLAPELVDKAHGGGVNGRRRALRPRNIGYHVWYGS